MDEGKGGVRDCGDQSRLLSDPHNGMARHNGRRRLRVEEAIDVKQADYMFAFTARVPVRRNVRNQELQDLRKLQDLDLSIYGHLHHFLAATLPKSAHDEHA